MRQETSSPKDRKTWKILAWLFIGSISIVSIAGYTLLTITINASSPKQILMGDAFVVQPTSESKADQVLLTAVAYSPDSISYYIEACGSHPYNGFLVLVDNAQITNMELEGEDIGTPIPKLQKLSSYPDAGNGYRVVHDILNIYPIVHSTGELISFKIPKVYPCIKKNIKDEAPDRGVLISGDSFMPVQESWSAPFGLWHGPHASQSWPVVGIQQGVDEDARPIVDAAGAWTYPSTEEVQLSYEIYSPDWSVDYAAPRTDATSLTNWSSASAIGPVAQVTDNASIARIQDWIVISAIGFGISGSILASLVFEWIRPRESRNNNSPHWQQVATTEPAGKSQPPVRSNRWLVFLAAAFIVGYARRRRRRHTP